MKYSNKVKYVNSLQAIVLRKKEQV
jgi:hypothetical protein